MSTGNWVLLIAGFVLNGAVIALNIYIRKMNREMDRQLARMSRSIVGCGCGTCQETGRHPGAWETSREHFKSFLTPQQLDQLKRGYVKVIGNDGHVYTINCAKEIYNVTMGSSAYCTVMPDPGIPVWDQYLAQLLMIQTDTRKFRLTAYRKAAYDY